MQKNIIDELRENHETQLDQSPTIRRVYDVLRTNPQIWRVTRTYPIESGVPSERWVNLFSEQGGGFVLDDLIQDIVDLPASTMSENLHLRLGEESRVTWNHDDDGSKVKKLWLEELTPTINQLRDAISGTTPVKNWGETPRLETVMAVEGFCPKFSRGTYKHFVPSTQIAAPIPSFCEAALLVASVRIESSPPTTDKRNLRNSPRGKNSHAAKKGFVGRKRRTSDTTAFPQVEYTMSPSGYCSPPQFRTYVPSVVWGLVGWSLWITWPGTAFNMRKWVKGHLKQRKPVTWLMQKMKGMAVCRLGPGVRFTLAPGDFIFTMSLTPEIHSHIDYLDEDHLVGTIQSLQTAVDILPSEGDLLESEYEAEISGVRWMYQVAASVRVKYTKPFESAYKNIWYSAMAELEEDEYCGYGIKNNEEDSSDSDTE